jgi:diketogulonate reductase-like aldo/keto reductase
MQYRTLLSLSLLSLAQAINLPQIQTPTTIDESTGVKAPPAEIPIIGFGTWSLPNQSGIDAVQSALKIGYRHLDGATAYGNQVSVGKGIAAALASTKDLSRSDIWVTTKLWSSRHGNMTESGITQALEQLNLTYVDLTLMHFPVGSAHGTPEYDIVKVCILVIHLTADLLTLCLDLGGVGEACKARPKDRGDQVSQNWYLKL